MLDIAAQVRAEIAKKKISINELASHVSLGRTALSQRINGHKEFTNGELEEVGAVLGVEGWELFRRASAESAGGEGEQE